ncbi:bi-domain-containing oxidoreductase [Coriobacteriia bacterium Es71-Z0120]|uniref:bi-domain-containing oxidoreductase n=1 Tax=Parvivirga hydrogeniphila TaxID=2939460 RepID=UPI002260AB35|nr:bi-domain-containing oxidoreductase [Parvivirga hydrogeniphila]MCL4079348.1 bi-domain-containing oxidoreductase [Parvivirga hydrogeniphila]
MKQVLVKQGQVLVEEVPAPKAEPGTVVVAIDHSCISAGTELSGMQASAVPLWKRALRNPDKVLTVLKMVTTEGVGRTKAVVEGRLASGDPTGYSVAGTVMEVGAGVADIAPGERVACAGAQAAHHAEVVRVPRNLVVKVPDGVSLAHASTVTLGAIALQGVRRLEPTLGESFVVIGLGILGQLTVQMLKADGCRVIALDLDASRVALAERLGADIGLRQEDGDAIERVARLTDGYGADGVIITAATKSSEVVSSAFKMCRRKGRVVLVGDVGLDIKREDIYAKELDFRISTSYGPGRYDARYEEHGLDYPIGYVRWTENRNMAEYLRLVADGKIDLDAMISAVYPVDEAAGAYEALKHGEPRPLMVLLSYPRPVKERAQRVVPNPLATPAHDGSVRIALIGAGGFAKGMHLPNIKAQPELMTLHAVCTRTGHNAQATARQYGARYATTDVEQVLADPEADAVLIATRHDLHAGLALKALAAGKHVLVEKPLGITRDEVERVVAFFEEREREGAAAPVLLTGFNRRFSPFAVRLKELTARRSDPMHIVYRMNAGYIPLDHWVHGPEGGGRNIGEACHIYDLFTYLTDARVTGVQVAAVEPRTGTYARNDNFTATFTFEDGSVATLVYTALGSADYPKEQAEVFSDGKIYVLDDYKALRVVGSPAKGVETKVVDKGQAAEIAAFARAVREGGDWPIPLWQQEQAMRMAFDVEDALRGER